MQLSLHEDIADLLGERPVHGITALGLEQLTGRSEREVRAALRTLQAAGRIRQVWGPNRWTLDGYWTLDE